MEAMAIYTWFSQLETSIYNGFSIAMLNNPMVRLIFDDLPIKNGDFPWLR